jgi:hypothetical protein
MKPPRQIESSSGKGIVMATRSLSVADKFRPLKKNDVDPV